MYNYNLNLTYQKNSNDMVYQKELLEVFNIKNYNDNIMTKNIEHLYEKVQNHFPEIIKEFIKVSPFPFQLPDKNMFQLLFSWEHFNALHLFLREIYTKQKINKNDNSLLTHLKLFNKK